MKELIKTFKLTTEKYKKEYVSVCEPIDGSVSKRNNASKFGPIHRKLGVEITEKLNDYIEQNPETDRNMLIEISGIYIKAFAIYLLDPSLK